MDFLVDVKLGGKHIAIVKVVGVDSIAAALAGARNSVTYELRETIPDCVVDLTPHAKDAKEG